MNFEFFTEGNEDVNNDLNTAYEEGELSSLTMEKQYENEIFDGLKYNSSIAPEVESFIHLVKEENKIKEYKLKFKATNGKDFRVYEVENLVVGKPVEYLYKPTILNIIKNKVKETVGEGFALDNEEIIIENYKNKLKQIIKK